MRDDKSLEGETLGNYEVGPELGRGGMGTVYRARSVAAGAAGAAGSVVALKVFQPELIADERTFRRFVREAELGIRIRHPNVVRTFEIAEAEAAGAKRHFMAMELVEGQTLRDLLEEIGALPEHLLHQIADQALAALSAVHAEGMIHRDVKPDNLVITGENRVLLMDLGVARLQQHGRDLTRAGEFVGSLHYAAPEQFMDQDAVGAAADIYGFGLVLYEMATGKNPFGAADLNTLISMKVKDQVRRPRTIERDLDPFLDDVILTCIKKDPAERFASCAELRTIMAEGEASAWWRERTRGETYPAAVRALKRLRPPRPTPLIGREAELERLHAAYQVAAGGERRLVVVRGAPGTGKSRLVHDFAEELVAPDGPRILVGGGALSAEESGPALVQALRGLLGTAEGLEDRLAALLPEMTGRVPALAAHLRGEASDVGTDALTAVWPLLIRSLARERPVVLVLEDLDRGAPDTIEAFHHLARSFEAEPVLLVATIEDLVEGSELHGAVTTLAQRPETTVLTLEPLARAVADDLVRAFVGNDRTARALGGALYEKSEGNPHILLEMLAHLRETGTLEETDRGLVPVKRVRDVDLPASIRELLEIKLNDLDAEQRETLEAAAVVGHEFDASLLAALTGERRIRLLKRLALLERKHRLVASAERNVFRFASRGLHHVVHDRIDPARRTELHSRCADAIREGWEGESKAPPREAFAFVRHLLAAGRILQAGLQVRPAAQHAVAQLHPFAATGFLERLLAALSAAPAAERFEICASLARLYALLGRSDERLQALDRAEAEAGRMKQEGAWARVHAGRAAALWSLGRYDEAEQEANRGLALAWDAQDRRVEAECLHLRGAVAYRRGDYAACVAAWHDALEQRRAAGDRRGEAATLQALGSVMPEIGEGDLALARKKEALAIFREIGDRSGEGVAINNIGNSYVEGHQVDEALACYEQAAAIARECGDLPAEAAALFNRGRTLAMRAQIEQAKESLERALDLNREIGDPAGEAEVLDELGAAIASYGEMDDALACLLEAHATAERTGQQALLARIRRHLANLRHERDETEEAWRLYEAALATAGERSRLQILADMGHAALREGDFDRAVDLLEQSLGALAGKNRTLLSLCRLARAHKAGGRRQQAREQAERAEALLQETGGVPPHHGPEIFYSLGSVLEEEARGRLYLARANELLGQRTRSIRSIVHRQHYLTMTWPNREILQEARRLL